MKMMISMIVLATLAAGCTKQQAQDTLEYLPYGLAKGACQGSSNCTLTRHKDSGDNSKTAPDQWYEDGYGRDERLNRPFR